MAFQIYAGWKEGEVWKRVPVTIAKSIETVVTSTSNEFPVCIKGYYKTDVKPTNLIEIWLNNVINNEKNEDKTALYFFETNNDSSKLPFFLKKLLDWGRYTFFWLINEETGSSMVTRNLNNGTLTGEGALGLISGTNYNGNSIKEIYESAETYFKAIEPSVKDKLLNLV